MVVKQAPIHGGDYILCIRDTGINGQVWEVDLSAEVTIGRSTNCKIHIPDKSVSRQQCRIFFNGNIIIENIGETNPTYLNDNLLETQVILKTGDVFEFGRIILIVDSITKNDTSGNYDATADETQYSGTVHINV